MTIEKVQTMSALKAKVRHNYREKEVPNADPDRQHLNDVMVDFEEDNIEEAWKKRKESLPYYENVKLRNTAVPALEIVMSVPKEDAAKINIEEWKKSCLDWVKKEFDLNPDKYDSNVMSFVYHGDESNAHIHAIVTPVDERGHFNASKWMNRKSLKQLQDSYGKSMKPFGLKRGLEKSTAKHQDIKRFYAKLDAAISVEQAMEIRKNETIEHYQKRMIDYVKTNNAVQLSESMKKDREIVELRTLLKQNQIKESTLDGTLITNKTRLELQKEKEQWEDLEREYGSPEAIKKKIETTQALNSAIKNYPDRNFAEETLKNIRELVKWQEEQEKKQKKEKERSEKAKAAEDKIFG